MVSVIIPTYNYGDFIADTLRSVLSQSHQDFECLVIDNGSTDNTAEVVKQFLNDKRFRYYTQANKGVASARNKGLTEAKGELILFLDADDLIEPEKLRLSSKRLNEHPEIDLVYSDMRYFRTEDPSRLYYSFSCDPSNDRRWMPYISGKGKILVDHLLDGNIIPISAPVTRKSVLSGISYFNEELHYNEDWDLWLRLALQGTSFYYLDEPGTMTLIRIHPRSASRDFFKMQCSGLKVLAQHGHKISELGLKDKVKTRIRDHLKLMRGALLESSGALFGQRLDILRGAGLFNSLFRFNLPGEFLKKLTLKLFKVEVKDV